MMYIIEKTTLREDSLVTEIAQFDISELEKAKECMEFLRWCEVNAQENRNGYEFVYTLYYTDDKDNYNIVDEFTTTKLL